MAASTIDEVLTELTSIIAESTAANSRLGYFATLYYKVTDSVKTGIASGEFEDGTRMEKLDVIFANRYLTAYDQWKNKQQPSASWKIAFESAERSSVLVLQHLLLGMNAHINLDLGIAAVEVSGTQPMQNLHNDFNNINTIISALTYQTLNEIGQVSPLLSLLGLHATNQTSVLIQFSIDNARDGAWCFAEDLSKQTAATYDQFITDRDNTIKKLADGLIYSTGFLSLTKWLIHLFEWKNPGRIIKVLNEYQKQRITITAS